MASINFNPFNENWFSKPRIPFQPINFLPLVDRLNPFKPQTKSPNFASISSPFSKKPKTGPNKPGKYRQMLDQFYWECENLPDFRHTPEVERILNEDPVFEKKESPAAEEVEENEKWWAEFRSNPVVQFLARAEEIADKLNELELQENSEPYRSEDKKLWKVFNFLNLSNLRVKLVCRWRLYYYNIIGATCNLCVKLQKISETSAFCQILTLAIYGECGTVPL